MPADFTCEIYSVTCLILLRLWPTCCPNSRCLESLTFLGLAPPFSIELGGKIIIAARYELVFGCNIFSVTSTTAPLVCVALFMLQCLIRFCFFFLFLLLSLNQLFPASTILVNASACASGSASLFLLVFNCLLFKIYWF